MHMNTSEYFIYIYKTQNTKYKQWLNFVVASCPLFITLYNFQIVFNVNVLNELHSEPWKSVQPH